MKKIYSLIYNLFVLLKVFCPVISLLYVLLWTISFVKISFYQILSIPFEPLANFINSIYPLTINYEGRLIDMSYIACSALFILFHYIFSFFAQRTIDLYDFQEKTTIKKRHRDIKKININLEKELNKELKKYSNFTLLFNVSLKSAYGTSENRKEEFETLKKSFYLHIIKNLKLRFKNSKGIISDKMFVLCENFSYFDKFITNFIEDIKSFKETNSQININTEFSISIDAVKSDTNIHGALEFLEKIDSFNYKNKIIVTSAFKLKYESLENVKFKITPLGVSRLFIEPDEYTDYELYDLRFKN